MLKDRHNVDFVKTSRGKSKADPEVSGFPTASKPHNPLYDVRRKLPIFTKDEKSKSFYCAGFYLVKLNAHWSKVYCPKLITLQRYEFQGPFMTADEQADALKKIHGL